MNEGPPVPGDVVWRLLESQWRRGIRTRHWEWVEVGVITVVEGSFVRAGVMGHGVVVWMVELASTRRLWVVRVLRRLVALPAPR